MAFVSWIRWCLFTLLFLRDVYVQFLHLKSLSALLFVCFRFWTLIADVLDWLWSSTISMAEENSFSFLALALSLFWPSSANSTPFIWFKSEPRCSPSKSFCSSSGFGSVWFWICCSSTTSSSSESAISIGASKLFAATGQTKIKVKNDIWTHYYANFFFNFHIHNAFDTYLRSIKSYCLQFHCHVLVHWDSVFDAFDF